MKARIDSNQEPVYGNNTYEKAKSSSTVFKLTSSNKGTDKTSQKSDFDNNVNRRQQQQQQQQLNGYSSRGLGQRNASPVGRNRHRLTRSDDYQAVERDFHQSPLHFDTQEILEETPAIFKSLNSSTTAVRGPDTFVYLSSKQSRLFAENEDDPCKTFVISADSDDFVNRKNTLNQSGLNGYGNKTTITRSTPTDADNEYLSYVIDKGNGQDARTMSQQEKNNKVQEDHDHDGGEDDRRENGGEGANGVVATSAVKCAENDSVDDEVCEVDEMARQQYHSGDSGVLSFDRTIAGKKEQAFAKLQDELQKAHQELKLKDEEVMRLTRIREDVERELEELTASLFQEAHKMVSKAKEKQAAAEKSLTESQMKMDVLSAEVVALKTLVLTSTPSRPNPHLHPQIGKEDSCGSGGGSGGGGGGVNLFNRKHRRSPSHFNLKYGRENSPPDSPVQDQNNAVNNAVPNSNAVENRDLSDVDPIIHKEFQHWSLNCKLDKTDPFIDRIYREDINLCLDFSNRELAEEVQKAIETRNIFIEAVTDKSKTIFPRKCALLEVTRQCHYRMKLGDQDNWYNISQMCRNRIIAVCDFINYLRYIELGLVKSSANDMYWEIMRLRKEMILARLGLSSPSS